MENQVNSAVHVNFAAAATLQIKTTRTSLRQQMNRQIVVESKVFDRVQGLAPLRLASHHPESMLVHGRSPLRTFPPELGIVIVRQLNYVGFL
jgi:hypothetical protein